MFEDEELIKLLQLISHICVDSDVQLMELGEEILCSYFEIFSREKKVQKFFYWLQIHIKENIKEKIKRHLRMNYKELDKMKVQEEIVRVEFDDGLKKINKPISEVDKIFRINCENNENKGIPSFYRGEQQQETGNNNYEYKESFKFLKGGRDHNLQSKLMNELETLMRT